MKTALPKSFLDGRLVQAALESCRKRMKSISPNCYLCGKRHDGKYNRDHVPPKQFFAKKLLQKHNPNLFWLPTHESCNKSYQLDEDYFVYSLMPASMQDHLCYLKKSNPNSNWLVNIALLQPVQKDLQLPMVGNHQY